MRKNVLAIDFGASSGRAILGHYDGKTIFLQEIHRFSNDPVQLGDTLYWDILRLFHEVKQSLLKSKEFGDLDSVAVDTWGVDFALLDKDGRLLENPVHYRDPRTRGMIPEFERYISSEKLYGITGIQPLEHNTLYQLLSLQRSRPDLLERANKLLMIPDLFSYFLCGEIHAELSAASTTQLLDGERKEWSDKIIETLGIRRSLFPPLLPSGREIGTLSGALCRELGMKPCKIIAACSHDTQSAMAAVPAKEKDFIFLSSGTWSLLGTELEQTVLTGAAQNSGLSNEIGFEGKTAFLKNINGLWLIQESRRQWKREGKDYSFAELEQLAWKAAPFRSFIDPDDHAFDQAGDLPGAVREYCKRTGQPSPESVGEVIRCIYESLALRYRGAVEEIEQCTGKRYDTIHIVGGGTKDQFLSAMTASACKRRVVSGPAEATAMGNIVVQLITLGAIENLSRARKLIAESDNFLTFEPENETAWDKAAAVYESILAHGRSDPKGGS